MRGLAFISVAVTALAASSLRAQAPVEGGGLETRVWLDRGDEPVLRRGETVRIYYRTSEDAYSAIFRIDTVEVCISGKSRIRIPSVSRMIATP